MPIALGRYQSVNKLLSLIKIFMSYFNKFSGAGFLCMCNNKFIAELYISSSISGDFSQRREKRLSPRSSSNKKPFLISLL